MKKFEEKTIAEIKKMTKAEYSEYTKARNMDTESKLASGEYKPDSSKEYKMPENTKKNFAKAVSENIVKQEKKAPVQEVTIVPPPIPKEPVAKEVPFFHEPTKEESIDRKMQSDADTRDIQRPKKTESPPPIPKESNEPPPIPKETMEEFSSRMKNQQAKIDEAKEIADKLRVDKLTAEGYQRRYEMEFGKPSMKSARLHAEEASDSVKKGVIGLGEVLAIESLRPSDAGEGSDTFTPEEEKNRDSSRKISRNARNSFAKGISSNK